MEDLKNIIAGGQAGESGLGTLTIIRTCVKICNNFVIFYEHCIFIGPFQNFEKRIYVSPLQYWHVANVVNIAYVRPIRALVCHLSVTVICPRITNF